jgi:hypothetical protein
MTIEMMIVPVLGSRQPSVGFAVDVVEVVP